MRTLRLVICLIVLLSLLAAPATAGPAAAGKTSPPRSTADVVTATVLPATLSGVAGGEVTFRVRLDIAEPWHLYDHSYALDEESFYIGVDLKPGEDASLAGFKTVFPEGELGEFMGDEVLMLHGGVDVEVHVRLPRDASGEVAIPLVVTAQACDNKLCLRPSDIPLTAVVTVE